MVHMWWTLQVVLEAVYPALVVPLAALIERRVDGLLCAAAALMLLAPAAKQLPSSSRCPASLRRRRYGRAPSSTSEGLRCWTAAGGRRG